MVQCKCSLGGTGGGGRRWLTDNGGAQERNQHYVVHIEIFLAKAFSMSVSDDDDEMLLVLFPPCGHLRTDHCSRAFDGIVPPHFYGVMAKTELGCEVLQEKGHFAEFAHFIRQHGLESEDRDLIIKLKSVLWAVVSYIVFHLCLGVSELRCSYRGILALRKVVYPSWRTKRLFLPFSRSQSSLWCSPSEGTWCTCVHEL